MSFVIRPVIRSKQSTVAKNIDDLAIFFIPTLEIVGSTKNQCPIIISENIEETNMIGNVAINNDSPTKLNAATKKLMKLRNK